MRFLGVMTTILFIFTASGQAQFLQPGQQATSQTEDSELEEYSFDQPLLKSNLVNSVPEYSNTLEIQDDKESSSRNTTSLTVGYIDDEFLLESDQGSNRFYYAGESAGAMISGKKAYLMASYGTADAHEGEGEIRSLAADLSFGGNKTLFSNFLRLPVSIYIPIRLNVGYRNLELTEQDDALHLANAGIGAGGGVSVRIPTGIPVIRDNLTGFAYITRSVGGIGDLSGTIAEQNGFSDDVVLSGIRLTQQTDLNIEGKFERLLGDNTGVTVGLTLRWMSWTEEAAEEFLQLLDVVTGNEDTLIKRSNQTFLRVGINW